MRLTLLGTGSADGWPNPFCTCPSCEAARAADLVRSPTAVLVDGTVLLDCGPEAPRQAVRAGARLDALRLLWVGHDHPDHSSPMALLSRSWARRPTDSTTGLTVAATAVTLASWRDWIGPDDDVTCVQAAVGHEIGVAGYRLLPLAATHGDVDPGLLALLTGPDGRRVLYGVDTGPLQDATVEALRGTELDALLLDETFGDRPDLARRGDHLDLSGFADQLDRLRDVGAVTDRTRVLAVHLSHHNPAEPQLRARLADIGAAPGRDGEVIELSGPIGSPERRRPGHRTLIVGGARSGKSTAAERLLAAEPTVDYVATGYPADASDPEWAVRVIAHQARRPIGWTTIETTDLVTLLECGGPPLLIDCLTLWLTRTLDEVGAWQHDAGPEATAAAVEAITALAAAWQDTTRRVVAVSNEVGSGVVPGTASGRLFRDLHGLLNARLGDTADTALLLVAGRAIELPARRAAT